MKQTILSLLLTFSLSLVSSADLLNKVSREYSHIKSAQGRFRQTALFPDGNCVVYEGVFYAEELRSCWIYEKPERQVVLVIGERVFIYNPKDGEVQKGELEFRLFSGSGLFNVDRIKKDFVIREGDDHIVAFPKADMDIEKIELFFQDLHLKKAVTVDKMGNISIIEFFDVKYNVKIPSEVFSLDYWRKH